VFTSAALAAFVAGPGKSAAAVATESEAALADNTEEKDQ